MILEFEFTQQEQMLRDAQLLGFTDEDHVLECRARGQLVVVIGQFLERRARRKAASRSGTENVSRKRSSRCRRGRGFT